MASDNNGAMRTGFIPQQVPIRSDTEPDIEEGELWYDTSSNTLKQKDSKGNFTGIGKTIDGVTIQENSNGDIEANGYTRIFGDFETDKGGWTGDFYQKNSGIGGAENTSARIGNATTSSVRQSDSNTLDLSDLDTLVVFYSVSPAQNGNTGDSNSYGRVLVDNNTELEFQGGSATDWIKAEIDVSSYGVVTVELVLDNTSSSSTFGVGFDRIRSVQGIQIEKEVSGAGGV